MTILQMKNRIKKGLFQTYLFVMNPINYILYSTNTKSGNSISNRIKGRRHLIPGVNVAIPEFCAFSGLVRVGDHSTLGIHNLMFGEITIGKYCQIGAYVALHGTNHPVSYPSTYINSRLFNGELAKHKTEAPIKVGNDVWIGHGSIILSGVTISDGAIVGAGSVVTKNIDPYSIVAGNPARFIRKRFSEKIIQEMLELKWWDKTMEELDTLKDLFHTDLTTVTSIYEIIKK
jgi:virginiamycin A acetyltransferase